MKNWGEESISGEESSLNKCLLTIECKYIPRRVKLFVIEELRRKGRNVVIRQMASESKKIGEHKCRKN